MATQEVKCFVIFSEFRTKLVCIKMTPHPDLEKHKKFTQSKFDRFFLKKPFSGFYKGNCGQNKEIYTYLKKLTQTWFAGLRVFPCLAPPNSFSLFKKIKVWTILKTKDTIHSGLNIEFDTRLQIFLMQVNLSKLFILCKFI